MASEPEYKNICQCLVHVLKDFGGQEAAAFQSLAQSPVFPPICLVVLSHTQPQLSFLFLGIQDTAILTFNPDSVFSVTYVNNLQFNMDLSPYYVQRVPTPSVALLRRS